MRQINLLPERLKKQEEWRIVRNSFLLTVGLSVAFVLLVHFGLNFCVKNLEDIATKPLALKETDEISQLKDKIDAVETKMKELVMANKEIIEVFAKNSSLSYLLKVIGNATADKVWLTDLSFHYDKKICQMKGLSFNTRLISEFMLELKALAYFENVTLVSMEKSREGSRETAFIIRCLLR